MMMVVVVVVVVVVTLAPPMDWTVFLTKYHCTACRACFAMCAFSNDEYTYCDCSPLQRGEQVPPKRPRRRHAAEFTRETTGLCSPLHPRFVAARRDRLHSAVDGSGVAPTATVPRSQPGIKRKMR